MVPHSLLAFVYHITEVSPYRDEMHHDMRQALRRFGVDIDMMRRLGNADAEAMLRAVERASFEVERASYDQRAPGPPLTVPMPCATYNLFTAIVPFLAWELEHEVPSPDQPCPPGEPTPTLLHSLYLLFYSREYRDKAEAPPALREKVRAAGVDAGAVAAAWGAVRLALALPPGRRVTAAAIEPALTTLLVAIAVEFSADAWQICW